MAAALVSRCALVWNWNIRIRNPRAGRPPTLPAGVQIDRGSLRIDPGSLRKGLGEILSPGWVWARSATSEAETRKQFFPQVGCGRVARRAKRDPKTILSPGWMWACSATSEARPKTILSPGWMRSEERRV